MVGSMHGAGKHLTQNGQIKPYENISELPSKRKRVRGSPFPCPARVYLAHVRALSWGSDTTPPQIHRFLLVGCRASQSSHPLL